MAVDSISHYAQDDPIVALSRSSSTPEFLTGALSSLRTLYEMMTNISTCSANCSGRGECLDGICMCLVQYEGVTCRDPNLAYFISFATVFYLIAAICFAQLMVCLRAEYVREKKPTLRKACRVTTQKMLYVITCVAATLRGAYFSSPANADLLLASSFLSAFYPIILTGGSLIVCFWAEAFHLQDIRCDRPRFLSKSICGFLSFNIVTYSLLIAEIIITRGTTTEEERNFFTHIFNGCYAILLFIVVVFFLIYGVEVYFKVRGGFVSDTIIVGNLHSRTSPHAPPSSPAPLSTPLLSPRETTEGEICALSTSSVDCVKEKLIPSDGQIQGTFEFSDSLHRGVDQSQLQQSRFGLVFQACMLMITVCFLFSDVLGGFWKNRVPLMSRNAYDIVFRIVELGVALWFPCVLWNCIAPEKLWILNPKRILKRLDIERSVESGEQVTGGTKANDVVDSANTATSECWICYDSERTDAGPLIEPCNCKGDVGAVHHDCLRKWLMECAETQTSERLSCKVCSVPYQLEKNPVWWIGQGFTARHWLHTASLVTVMCGTVAGAWAVIQLYEDAYIRSLAAGVALLVLYICLRFLGFNTFSAYQRARFSAVKILNRLNPMEPNVAISGVISGVTSATDGVAVDFCGTEVVKLPESHI